MTFLIRIKINSQTNLEPSRTRGYWSIFWFSDSLGLFIFLTLTRNWPTLLVSSHFSTSRIFWNFRWFWPHFFLLFALFDPSKRVWPRWAKNLNCKYNYLTNQIQLSSKQWGWQLLWAPFMGLRNENFLSFRFSTFNES